MDSTKELVTKIQDELSGLTSSIREVVESMKKLQEPIDESRRKVPEATQQLTKITEQTEQAAHQMIDRVENISMVSEDILNEIKVLRKVLPSTYFKNRSGIRDTVQRIEDKAKQNLDDAFIILNALQFQDITSQQVQHASVLMQEVEFKLKNLMSTFAGKKLEEIEESQNKGSVYDPNASFSSTKETQEDVDSIIASINNRS